MPDDKKQAIVEAPTSPKELTDVNSLDKTATETLLALISTKNSTEAAERLGITRQAVWLRVQKYGLNKWIEQIPKQALARLQLGSDLAAEKLVEKLDDRREGLEAAKEILNRVGISGDKPGVLQQFNVKGEMSVDFVE